MKAGSQVGVAVVRFLCDKLNKTSRRVKTVSKLFGGIKEMKVG